MSEHLRDEYSFLKKKVMFMGSKSLGMHGLKTIHKIAPQCLHSIVTIDDTDDPRSILTQYKKFADKTRVNFHILTRPKQMKSVIENDSPDMCIILGWYWIIKEELLRRVPDGFLGLHASLLPKYRGGSPLVWAILNGEKESGLSLFYFDNGIDSGDIVDQRKFNIDTEDTIMEILQKAESLADEILKSSYPLLLRGTAPRRPQGYSSVTAFPMRKPQDGQILWTEKSLDIHNAIRAQTHPYPGAFCFTENEEKIRVWKSKLVSPVPFAKPGTMLEKNSDGYMVACGEGGICLTEIEFESSRHHFPCNTLKQGTNLK